MDFVTQQQQALPKKRKQAAANLGYFGFWAAVMSVHVGQEGLIQMLMATFVPQRRRPLHRAVPPVAAKVSTAIKHF